MTCMWLSAVARNLLVMQANRAQISLAAAMLPPCPMQNTCRARQQQRHSLIHRLRRKGVLGAIDGGHEQC